MLHELIEYTTLHKPNCTPPNHGDTMHTTAWTESMDTATHMRPRFTSPVTAASTVSPGRALCAHVLVQRLKEWLPRLAQRGQYMACDRSPRTGVLHKVHDGYVENI